MRALLLLLALPLAACTGGAATGAADAGARRRAAVAIRDEVPGYQQLGTEYFTVPNLERGYLKHWYLTESGGVRRRAELLDALTGATDAADEVDLFLLAHGNSYVTWVEDLPPARRAKLRLVYNTAGDGADQARSWLALGVQAYVAHPGGNVAPLFYAEFLPRWTRGEGLDDAVDAANRVTHEQLFSATGRLGAAVVETLHGGPPIDVDALWAGTEARVFRP